VGTRLVWNRVPEFAEISQTAMPTVMHPESMMALHKRIPQWVDAVEKGLRASPNSDSADSVDRLLGGGDDGAAE